MNEDRAEQQVGTNKAANSALSSQTLFFHLFWALSTDRDDIQKITEPAVLNLPGTDKKAAGQGDSEEEREQKTVSWRCHV